MKKYLVITFSIAIFLLLGWTTGISQIPSHGEGIGIPGLTFEAEMLRLNIISRELKDDPAKIIYLIAYAGRRERSSAKIRLSRSKQYLVKHHSIAAAKIKTVYAGGSGGMYMLIHVVPASLPSGSDK